MPSKIPLRIAFAVLLMAGWLTGCSASTPTGAETSMLVVGVPAGSAAVSAEAAALEYAHATGARLRVETIPQTAYERRVGEVLVAGLSDYDLLYLPAASLPKYAGYHALQTWDPQAVPAEGETLARWLPLLTVDGVLYGLPADADPLLLWYRVDLLADYGLLDPAQDMESFHAYALAASDPPERYGYLPARSATDAAMDLAAFLHGYGARVFEPAGDGKYRVALDSSEARTALEAFAALLHTGGVTPEMAAASPLLDPARAEGQGRQAVLDGLRKGEAALAFAPRSAGESLQDCSAPSPACAEDRSLLASGTLPASCRLIAGLNAWVVPQRARHAEAAMRFAGWLVSPEGAAAWSTGGISPIMEEGACFATTFPPAPQPGPFWEALGQLAVDLMQGELVDAARINAAQAQAEEALHDALRKQGMLDE